MMTDEQRLSEVLDVLQEVRDLIDGYVDVKDGDYGVPRANKAMKAVGIIDDLSARIEQWKNSYSGWAKLDAKVKQ